MREELAGRLSGKVLTASTLKPEALPQEQAGVAVESGKTDEAASADAKPALPNAADGVGQNEGVTVKDVVDNKIEVQPTTESTTTVGDKAAATTHAKATPATHAVSQLAEFCGTYLRLQEALKESDSKLALFDDRIKKAVVSLALKLNVFEESLKSVRIVQTALDKSMANANRTLHFLEYVQKYDGPLEDDDDVCTMTAKAKVDDVCFADSHQAHYQGA